MSALPCPNGLSGPGINTRHSATIYTRSQISHAEQHHRAGPEHCPRRPRTPRPQLWPLQHRLRQLIHTAQPQQRRSLRISSAPVPPSLHRLAGLSGDRSIPSRTAGYAAAQRLPATTAPQFTKLLRHSEFLSASLPAIFLYCPRQLAPRLPQFCQSPRTPARH